MTVVCDKSLNSSSIVGITHSRYALYNNVQEDNYQLLHYLLFGNHAKPVRA